MNATSLIKLFGYPYLNSLKVVHFVSMHNTDAKDANASFFFAILNIPHCVHS